jgi:hypothetical protein
LRDVGRKRPAEVPQPYGESGDDRQVWLYPAEAEDHFYEIVFERGKVVRHGFTVVFDLESGR